MDRPAFDDVLYDLSDTELIEEWRKAGPEFHRARTRLQKSEGELVRRMGERLSLETESGTVVRSPQLGDYQWDRNALRLLFGDRLSASMWDSIFVPVTTTKTMTAQVKKYAKQLGLTDADLAKCYFRAERKQDLEFCPPLIETLRQSVEARS